MARKRINNAVQAWAPSGEELKVVEYLAAGYSQNRTAALTGVPQRTISSWWQRAEFQKLVADRTVEFLESADDVFEQSRALAQLVYHQGLTGERPDDDGAVKLARDFLAATVWRQKAGEKHLQFGQQPESA